MLIYTFILLILNTTLCEEYDPKIILLFVLVSQLLLCQNIFAPTNKVANCNIIELFTNLELDQQSETEGDFFSFIEISGYESVS